MDLTLVFHLRFGDLSVELSASHVSCSYTFYFLFTCFFFTSIPDSHTASWLRLHFISFHHPRQRRAYRWGKKVTMCERCIHLWGASHTEQKHESVVHVLTLAKRASFPSPCRFCAVPFDYYALVFCRCILIGSVNLISHMVWRAHVYMYSTCAHRYTDTPNDALKDFTWERDERKVAAWRGRTETDWRQSEGNEKVIRGREGWVISGRIHYVCVCVSLYHQTTYYVQVISSSARFHKENPFTCAWMNQQLSLFRVAEPRKRVCFHFLYHVVLGSCLFSSSDALKYCGQENRVQVFFLLRSLGVSPASDWSRDKHELHFLWVCSGWVIFFLFWLSPSALKWIRVIGSIFLTRMIVFQNRTPNSLSLCLRGVFCSIDNQ